MKKAPGSKQYAERQDRLRTALALKGAGAALITELTDIRYLCGFTGSNGLLAVTAEGAHFFTDSRYTLQAAEEVRQAAIHTTTGLDRECAGILSPLGIKGLGISFETCPVERFKKLKRLYRGIEIVDTSKSVSSLRILKTKEEIKRLRAASRLAEEAFRRTAPHVKKGVTEREAAIRFHVEALSLGAEGLAFETILAGGERGALPHAPPGTRPFADGDLVVFDFGVKLDGYMSDQTVTLSVGRVSEEAARVHGVVLEARSAALKKIAPGVLCSSVDKEARDLIKSRGYGEFFGHGTGHGLGMMVHEAPTLAPKSDETLVPGMVFSVEPGIYLPGKFGVRLEDIVHLTPKGPELLTTLSKELGAYA